MVPSRRSQPHRRGMWSRQPGTQLEAMLRGGPQYLPNPAALQQGRSALLAALMRARGLRSRRSR